MWRKGRYLLSLLSWFDIHLICFLTASKCGVINPRVVIVIRDMCIIWFYVYPFVPVPELFYDQWSWALPRRATVFSEFVKTQWLLIPVTWGLTWWKSSGWMNLHEKPIFRSSPFKTPIWFKDQATNSWAITLWWQHESK